MEAMRRWQGGRLFLMRAEPFTHFFPGCDVGYFNEKKTPKGADQFARDYIDLLRKGDMGLARGRDILPEPYGKKTRLLRPPCPGASSIDPQPQKTLRF